MPLQTTARVWDALLLEGSKVMLRVALAIFSRYENTICNSSYPMQLKKVSTEACQLLLWHPAGSTSSANVMLAWKYRVHPVQQCRPAWPSSCSLVTPPCSSASKGYPAGLHITRPALQVLEARLSRAFDADALMSVAFKGVGSMPNSSIQLLRQRALQDIHEQQLEHQRRLAALLGKAQRL